jgi:integrase
MPSVERLLRVRYYLGKKQVPASTPNATRVEEWSKDYYGVVYENGKRVRYRLEGVTTKTKAEQKWKELLAEAKRSIKEENSRSRDLVEGLVDKYEKDLSSTGIKKKTIKDEIDKIRSLLLESLQVIRLEEINISVIQEELQNSKTSHGGRKPKPRSARTKNYYIGTLVRFGKWLKENKHWKKNIFVRLKRFKGSHVKVRREMTADELKRLIETARTRGLRKGTKEQGEERAVFYTFLFYTLTRYGSAKKVVVGQLNFTRGHEEIVLRGDQVKSKKAVTKPLHPLLVKELQAWIKKRKLKQTDLLFPGIKSNLINQFNIDLQKAGIQKVLPDGTSLDIHAFKTTAISMLHDAGVPIKVIQHLAEHASANTTLAHYARANRESLSQAYHNLPDLKDPLQ